MLPRGVSLVVAEFLYAGLRLAHDIVDICPRSRCPHRPTGGRPHRRQYTLPQQRRLRFRHQRHRKHRSAPRSTGRAQRPQQHGRPNQHTHPSRRCVRRASGPWLNTARRTASAPPRRTTAVCARRLA